MVEVMEETVTQSRTRLVARRAAERLGVSGEEAERVLRDALAELTRGDPAPVPDAAPRPCARDADDEDAARPGSYVRVPYLSKSEQGRPLQRVVAYAADHLGTSHFLAAAVMTYLLEGIADEVGLGRVVRLPGFGIFAPYHWTGEGGRAAVYPRFVAARPFRNQVNASCPAAKAQNHALATFQRSHHPSSRPEKHGTTFKAMDCWRKSIVRQAGYDVGWAD